ncbi:MAG: hypothetical protein ACYTBJ_14530 [Planctomycetota bacterium]|jgi:hypothetical protein
MDESKKKPIMIGVVVVCLITAALITWDTTRGPSGIEQIPADEMTWVKCRYEACEYGWEMTARDYFTYLEDHAELGSVLPPPITCPECDEPSGYEAFKCPKCNKVWEKGTVKRDYEDRCPDCKYSQSEVDRHTAVGLPPPTPKSE